jgi:hypothetical protein
MERTTKWGQGKQRNRHQPRLANLFAEPRPHRNTVVVDRARCEFINPKTHRQCRKVKVDLQYCSEHIFEHGV